ncbi:palmitoyl-acyl carrier protein thioesterase [Spatholobus suberectus]|nr:palmitoyl-acyl carrier protein thioesterase [Spatholobus suberectus]
MEIESVKCECCGLKEDCTQDYISEVKSKFDGKWLCGLCSEAVRDEVSHEGKKPSAMDEAVKAHMSFCRKFKSNPAVRVAEGMRQMLRRRSGDLSSSSASSKKYSRSTSASQVGDSSSFPLYR